MPEKLKSRTHSDSGSIICLNMWGGGESKKLLLKSNFLPHISWNRLLRRSWLIEHELFFHEGIVHEDTHLIFYLAKHTSAFAICEKETYFYNIRDCSITMTVNPLRCQSMDWIIADHSRHIDRRNILAQIVFVFHAAHLTYVSRLPADKPLPNLAVRCYNTLKFLFRVRKIYRNGVFNQNTEQR